MDRVQRHLGEFDKKVQYGRFLRKGGSVVDRVVREKKREDTMRNEGNGMSRSVWSVVVPDTPRRTMVALLPVLERSRRLYVGPGAAG